MKNLHISVLLILKDLPPLGLCVCVCERERERETETETERETEKKKEGEGEKDLLSKGISSSSVLHHLY